MSTGVRTVPPRSPWAQLIVVLGALLLAPYLGLRLGMLLAPESELVQIASVFTFVLTLLGGMLMWFGTGVVTLVVGALWRLVRGRVAPADRGSATGVLVPPGYGAFVILGGLFGALTGILAAVLTALTLPVAVGWWGGVGLAYGGVLWNAAHRGYLPFPEPE